MESMKKDSTKKMSRVSRAYNLELRNWILGSGPK